MSNYNYELERQKVNDAYLKCFTKDGIPIICMPDDKRKLIRVIQEFSKKSGLADNQVYFGSIERAYINEAEVSKIFRMTSYDL